MKHLASEEAIKTINELNNRLENGRHYLMGVPEEEITVEDALEAFGYTRNGFDKEPE